MGRPTTTTARAIMIAARVRPRSTFVWMKEGREGGMPREARPPESAIGWKGRGGDGGGGSARGLVRASDVLALALDLLCMCFVMAPVAFFCWQEMLFPELIKNWKAAVSSADTYHTTEWHNDLIVCCVMVQQGGTLQGAWQLVRSDTLLPSSSTPPFATRGVLKYLTHTVDYFYSAIGTTALRIYL